MTAGFILLRRYFGPMTKAFTAFALACGLSLSARAQIGTGWAPTTETYIVQKSSGCTAVASPSGIGGVFSVPTGFGRAEFRFQNLSESVLEQFQGDVTVNSISATGRITMKQTFGPDPSTPWSLIACRPITGGLQIYEVETGSTLLNHYIVGSTIRINTIYNPTGGAGNVTVDVYINGAHVEQVGSGTGPDYNKIGAYVSSSGSGPATYTWQNVLFWTGGTMNGGTPVVVDTPSFNPAAGTYTGVQSVTISSTTSGASIAYTTDGSTPTESGGTVTHGTLLSNGGSVSISSSLTLMAIAFESGQTDSPAVPAAYTINGVSAAATPTFSPPAGAFTSAQSVAISSASSGVSIAYTTDGSTPTEFSGTVTHGALLSNGGSVSVGTNLTLKAIAFGGGFADSAVGTAAYTITPPAATLTFAPPAGTYTGAQSVAISSTTSGVSIAYTADGSTPTEVGGTVTNGTLLSNGGSVSVSTNLTLEAIAFGGGFADSAVGTAAYMISAPIPTILQIQGSNAERQPAPCGEHPTCNVQRPTPNREQ